VEIVVTDLTKFHKKVWLCLAGVNPKNYECIRPLPYLQCNYCLQNQILPGARLTGSFKNTGSEAPHCEDRDCHNLINIGACNYEEFYSLLTETLSHSLEAGFGVKLESGQKHIGCECSPEKSIITIEVEPNELTIVKDQYKPGRIKGIFEDEDGNEFKFISITDYCFCEFAERTQTDEGVIRNLNEFLSSQEKIYLRIGLTRRHQSQDGRDGFWIQINGIYSFPDIYDGITNLFKK